MQDSRSSGVNAAPGLLRPGCSTQSHLIVKPNTVIFQEGERGCCAYVIERGRVEISVERSGQKIVLGHRGPGEVFGEMAIIDDEPRSATVRATERCDLLMITRDQLSNRLEQTDPVLRMCLTVILERFRTTLLRLQVIGHEAPGAALPGHREPAEAGVNGIYDNAIREIKLEHDLRDALEQEEFQLNYQPIVDLASGGRLAGFEALIRWHHPEKGLIAPGDFLPTAEASGLIVPLGHWIMREACAALERIAPALPGHAGEVPPFISINLSSRDLYDPNFLVSVDRALHETGVDPGRIHFEITETLLIQQPEEAAAALQACRSMGLRIAIDDFGTGYSSLSYLHQFPIDLLKVDQTFVSNMHASAQHRQIVSSIVHLAQELEMQVIAEGIERPDQEALLRELGCNFGQGFLFAPALKESDAREYVIRRRRGRLAAAQR